MIKVIIFAYLAFLASLFVVVDNKGISIPLFREKSPHEVAANTNNIAEHGIWLDWLKPNPHKPNRTNDSIALYRFLDREFYGKVIIGTKGQSLDVLFDTTWGTSWVLSKDCPTTKVGCWFHDKYDHSKSTSYIKDGRIYNVNEGTFNLTGYYSTDTINIAHSRVKSFSFVEMTSVPYINIFSKADGVMGLAMKYGDRKPFIYGLLENGGIKKPIFSIYLNRDRQSEHGGNIMIGDYDKKYIHVTNREFDNITYVNVKSTRGLWEFKMDGVNIIINNVTKIISGPTNAMVDSSSNAIICSKDQLAAINEIMKATHLMFGRYQVKCDTVTKLPRVNFRINGNNFNLTGKQFVQKVSLGGFQFCISPFIAASSPSEDNTWILGGAFLAEYYSIYNILDKTIGFVKAA